MREIEQYIQKAWQKNKLYLCVALGEVEDIEGMTLVEIITPKRTNEEEEVYQFKFNLNGNSIQLNYISFPGEVDKYKFLPQKNYKMNIELNTNEVKLVEIKCENEKLIKGAWEVLRHPKMQLDSFIQSKRKELEQIKESLML